MYPIAVTKVVDALGSMLIQGGKVYAVGGFANGRTDQPLLEEYDPASDIWRSVPPMPRGANHVAVVGFGGKLCAFGSFVHHRRRHRRRRRL